MEEGWSKGGDDEKVRGKEIRSGSLMVQKKTGVLRKSGELKGWSGETAFVSDQDVLDLSDGVGPF